MCKKMIKSFLCGSSLKINPNLNSVLSRWNLKGKFVYKVLIFNTQSVLDSNKLNR